ncbi:MAG: chemotaxis-specific protein-glutamate methyltransferase CheB [Bdellovibrionales bacterium]|nr:chemotaxis-specific protein-glutamate methyltransferase CheB [Bdellovibrionales bacterium]
MKGQVPTLHLNIGELIVSPTPAVISTVLGSCVSVCLFSTRRGVGGMIHYAHPEILTTYGQERDFRYGEIAIPSLICEMQNLTSDDPSTFQAKIVGGASEIDGGKKSFDIGEENIKVAREILRQYNIPIVGESVGGPRGRKVLFHTAGGRLQVAQIIPSAAPIAVPSIVSSKSPAKRKVLVVDDSKTIRDLLKRILSVDPDLEIIGFAADAFEAAELVKKQKPDVITLDIHMPGMTGVEWLEKLLPKNPIPVVMISSLQLQEGNEVFRALELGAVDYIQKPSLSQLADVGPLIREKVKEASRAKVIRHGHVALGSTMAAAGALDFKKILAIGASTGGTEALKSVMCALPEKIPPTVIVQHIPPVFSKAFADRLNSLCPFEVKEAEDGDEVRPSRVLIAPGGLQMKLQRTTKGLCVRITDDPPMSRHKPSVDYLFQSVAAEMGKNSVGVILTGMGADGAKGLLQMRQQGAHTIGQDEESCVVYGMPRAAYEMGAVEKVASLTNVPREILNLFAQKKAA